MDFTNIKETLDRQINQLTTNDYVFAILSILMVSYGSLARVEMPKSVKDIFNNPIFNMVFMFSLMVFSLEHDPSTALIVAVIFISTLHFINQDVMSSLGYMFGMSKSKASNNNTESSSTTEEENEEEDEDDNTTEDKPRKGNEIEGYAPQNYHKYKTEGFAPQFNELDLMN